jgi:prepilin-type N-terminal cleavage/methylation domain-containing protein/prepilin-type processing-associated H-X9-DG protein
MENSFSIKIRGFTLIELLIVIAIIAILASVLLPVFSSAKKRGEGIQCLSNLKQMTLGWQLYTDESNNHYPINSAMGHNDPYVGEDADNPSWVAGALSPTGLNMAGDNDNTNIEKLTGDLYLRFGSIGSYTKRPGLYHCPGDQSSDVISRQPRVRSISMNGWISPGKTNDADSACWSKPFQKFVHPTDFHGISPSGLFVFLDERPDSINDGWFWIPTGGYNNDGSVNMNDLQIADLPAIYHNRCSAFSFADGHVELHHWIDGKTYSLTFYHHAQPVPGNVDAAWLLTHATVHE